MTGNEKNEMTGILKFYKDANSLVHVSCFDNYFYNGTIIEIQEDLIIFDDKKNGPTAIAINNIKRVTPFRGAEE